MMPVQTTNLKAMLIKFISLIVLKIEMSANEIKRLSITVTNFTEYMH